jgi:alcohol dehydrogenase class IV
MPNVSRVLHFQMPGKVVFGVGAVGELPGQVRRLGGGKIFLVTDPGLVKCGVVARVTELLAKEGFSIAVFSDVEPDPRVETAEACGAAARGSGANLVIGLGGGSAIDVAKLAALQALGPVDLLSYVGIGKVPARGLPVIAIPTTAGTGSEVTPIAVLSDHAAHLKKGIVSEHLVPSVALVDPALTVSLPPRVTAYTGMDVLTHCIEAYTNKFAVPFVDALALEGIRHIGRSLRVAVRRGDDLAARESMALGSLYGGLCLGPVNTAAVHAMAYPLGGTFNVPHGLANTVLLPHVMAFNLPACAERYAVVAECLGEEVRGMETEEAARRAISAVSRLAADVGMNVRLRDLGIPQTVIAEMAAGAVLVTRLMQNNPRVVTETDAAEIYRAAF